MKYRCIKPFYISDSTIMDINDIVVLKENNLYNITKKIDYTNISKADMDIIKNSIEFIADNLPETNNVIVFDEITTQLNFIYKSKNND